MPLVEQRTQKHLTAWRQVTVEASEEAERLAVDWENEWGGGFVTIDGKSLTQVLETEIRDGLRAMYRTHSIADLVRLLNRASGFGFSPSTISAAINDRRYPTRRLGELRDAVSKASAVLAHEAAAFMTKIKAAAALLPKSEATVAQEKPA